ncbi:MAG: sugar transferase [Rhodococcus sp. (in: high G+C Gram-positive bacteria)]|nr:sugar transferase [Rhodococcus sp. (in: high G+C Gram-positive bacteria)]MDI6629531.1 sugar transferase [Rhodococcus sp. (in: high G+C Gram-positive bacteria)]
MWGSPRSQDAVATRKLTSRRVWEQRYIRRLRVTDVVAVVTAVGLAHVVRFGDVEVAGISSTVTYAGVSVVLAGLWIAFLAIFRTRSTRVIGNGAEEYRRIVSATFRLFGVIAIVSLLFRIEFARLYLAIALPVGLLALLLSRWIWRNVVSRLRGRGEYKTSVLIVGSRTAAVSMAQSFEKSSASGFAVVGICMPGYEAPRDGVVHIEGTDIPVLGDEHDVLDAIEECGADTVAVTATEHLGHKGIRKMIWDLEKTDVDLVVAPGVVDVAGPRLVMRPVAGFPLIHVEKPQYNGATRFSKTAFDFTFAALVLVMISPILMAVAIAVKSTSRGPVFYKSERMGIDGKPFSMIKFRSMTVDADKQVTQLLDENEGAGGVLFKMRDDPRVTPVGKVLRRFSLDELPQFVNVLKREMSVVGPRPPLRREVETYNGEVRRRLLVKPGVTGLWQVSGRSDLSWEETVRLDLSYVENWSMVGDLLIIAKTMKAVVGSDGAY